MPAQPMEYAAARAELLALLRRGRLLSSIGELLDWDAEVNLPRGAVDQRTEQRGLLAEMAHADGLNPRIGELLLFLEQSPDLLHDTETANIVREARLEYDEDRCLAPAFVGECEEAASRSREAWELAYDRDDFSLFAPSITRCVDLARRRVGLLQWEGHAYDRLLEEYMPGASMERLDPLFAEMATGLKDLRATVRGTPLATEAQRLANGIGEISGRRLKGFAEEVFAQCGFDLGRGRFDLAGQSFCIGSGPDVRIAVDWSEGSPLTTFFTLLHEIGHGLYEQGIPGHLPGTVYGVPAGMGVHESQSQIWEYQVGRSRGFWRWLGPKMIAHFPEALAGYTPESLRLASLAPDNSLVRLESDEINFNLHIVLRYEIERRLFAGDLAAADIPAAWGDLCQKHFGRSPVGVDEGPLQDSHWGDAEFGYFPAYALGNLVAAQLWREVRRQRPGIEDEFAAGDFTWFMAWLRQHVHAHGATLDAFEIVERATGSPLSVQPLLDDLRERYSALGNVVSAA